MAKAFKAAACDTLGWLALVTAAFVAVALPLWLALSFFFAPYPYDIAALVALVVVLVFSWKLACRLGAFGGDEEPRE